MDLIYEQIRENFLQVSDQIAAAARRANRQPESVRLVVVTKTHPIAVVQAVVEAGATYLGENYADEALPKIQTFSHVNGLQWHMIGHVQSRKSGQVSAHFDYLHSLDSIKLAQRLDRQCAEEGRVLPVLIECNTSQEETKHGFSAWDERSWPALVDELGTISTFSSLSVCGLMTMAPFSEDPETARPYFRRLRALQEYLARALPFSGWAELSMGMSGDFEIAIEEGATWVRIGTRILGARKIV